MKGWPLFFFKYKFNHQHLTLRGYEDFLFLHGTFFSWTNGNGGFPEGNHFHLELWTNGSGGFP
jgi:hypothetical protein